MNRLFRLDKADFEFIERASKQFFNAQAMQFDMQSYIDYLFECWRQLGWKYGFDPKTMIKAPNKPADFILAIEVP